MIIYYDIKSDDEVRLFKDFDRLIVCIGMEKVEYEDEIIMDYDRITGKIDWHLYKYTFRIPIESDFKIKSYIIDKNALIVKLEKI